MPKRPAHSRRVTLYDLNEAERKQLAAIADAENRTVSRWASDAVRNEIKRRALRLTEGK